MKLAFVHIPKTAGASVKDWFDSNCPNTLIHNGHRPLTDWQIPKDYDYSFTVVRNTYYRLISAYEYTKARSSIKYNKRLSKNQFEKADSVKEIMTHLDDGIVPWLSHMLEINNNFVWPLSTWTKDVDIILNQESLDEDFKKISNLVNVNMPLQKSKHVQTYNSKRHLTDRYLSFVYMNFCEEIKQFGFEP